MSGYQLLQSAHVHPQNGAGLFHGQGRGDQLGVHVLTLLRQEQAALRLALLSDHVTEREISDSADALQIRFGQWAVTVVVAVLMFVQVG